MSIVFLKIIKKIYLCKIEEEKGRGRRYTEKLNDGIIRKS